MGANGVSFPEFRPTNLKRGDATCAIVTLITVIKMHMMCNHWQIDYNITLFRLGFFLEFLSLGGGLQKPPPLLHKSESINAIIMKLGG